MDLSIYTVEQIKTLHNSALAIARDAATNALACREEIVKREARYRGASLNHIKSGVQALYDARTFAGTPNDLPEEQNPYRTSRL